MKIHLTLLLFAWVTVSFAQSKKTETFLAEYASIATKKNQGIERPVTKWRKDTIRYQFIGNLEYISRKAWAKFIEEIEKCTSKKLLESTEADIIIYFGTMSGYYNTIGKQMPAYAEKFSSWTNKNWTKEYEITKASFCLVPLKINNPNYGLHVLKRSMLLSMGLNGANPNASSVLHKEFTQSNYHFTKRDKQLLKLHYSSSIEPSMTAKEALRIADEEIDLEALMKEKL